MKRSFEAIFHQSARRAAFALLFLILGAVTGAIFATRAFYAEQRHENTALKVENASLASRAQQSGARASELTRRLAALQEKLGQTQRVADAATERVVASRKRASRISTKLVAAWHRVDSAYANGKAAGYEQGSQEGYDAGYDDGYNDGVNDLDLTTTPSLATPSSDCDANYSGACVLPYDTYGDVDCPDIPETDFDSVGTDPHGLDADGDGIACESS
jgi:hypothetical protein